MLNILRAIFGKISISSIGDIMALLLKYSGYIIAAYTALNVFKAEIDKIKNAGNNEKNSNSSGATSNPG